jgi:phage tail sheath protein FI
VKHVLAPAASSAPGVYYQRVDAGPPRINPLRTDVAGFVGIAERGPLHTAVPVLSWRQFQAFFGDFTGAGFLAYAVRAFFENGGKKCWVVRVASEAAATASIVVGGIGTSAAYWRLAACSPGVWGNDVELTLVTTHHAQTKTEPQRCQPEASGVESTAGFARGTHVRLSQDGLTWVGRVVSAVDVARRRLIWVHEKPEGRLPYDTPVSGFAVNQPILIQSVEYRVIVREGGRLIRSYEGLSLVPEHPRYGPRVLPRVMIAKEGGSASEGQVLVKSSNVTLSAFPVTPEPIVITDLRGESRSAIADAWNTQGLAPFDLPDRVSLPLVGGADGLAALRVGDFIGEESSPWDSDEVKARKRRGLRVLEEEDEVSILAVPDIHIQPRPKTRYAPLPPCIPDPCLPAPPPFPAPPRPAAVGDLPPVFSEAEIMQVQAAMVQQCETRRDRVALLDPPFSTAADEKLGVNGVRAWRQRFDSSYAALYYPWVRVVDPLRLGDAVTRLVPPSGHVAGQYAHTDTIVGVHKAPANSPLEWVQDLSMAIDDAIHGVLNPAGINAIRVLGGRGPRIFGARTVSSDADWRFINVRRLLLMIEKAIRVATQWAVFEPNDAITRAKLHLSISGFLWTLWQQGALAGKALEEAFFVRCDETNNPPSARDNGQLLVEVGVAPAQPFEFIIVRVGRVNNEFEIAETALVRTGGGNR